MSFIVYFIEDQEKNIIYVGHTKDLSRRTYGHNHRLKKGFQNKIYNHCRENNIKDIILIPFMEFKTKADAKRMEMLFILQDYFGEKELKQSIPNISDR